MQKENTDDDSNMKEPDSVKGNMEQKAYATPQEIESGKLPPEEILSLPMFKVRGPPAFRYMCCIIMIQICITMFIHIMYISICVSYAEYIS